MEWKDTVTSFSDRIFPGLSYKISNHNYENEVLTNLPLQMCLYFNAIFIPVWSIIIILFLYDSFHRFDDLYKIISLGVTITIFLIEILRLYLGYEGNLKDKIPELAGFWMISILLQFPLQTFLLFNPYFSFFVLEVVVQSIMYVMLLIQLVSGYWTLRNTATQQATYFRIMKLSEDITVADIQKRFKLD